jgi:hypothetical protein
MTRVLTHSRAAGPVPCGQVPSAIGIVDAPDHPMPIGMASCVGWDGAGLAVRRLTVHNADLPGRWIIIDREFRPVEG